MRSGVQVSAGVLALLCALEPVARAAPRWSIAWPQGWTDVTQDVLQTRDMQARMKRLSDQGAISDLTVQASASGDALQVLYTSVPVEVGADSAAFTRGFERGARNSGKQASPEVSYEQRDVGNTLVADQAVTVDGTTAYTRRILGSDGTRVFAVQATCRAAQPVCSAALGSLTLDATGFRRLRFVDSSDWQIVGTLCGSVAGALLAAWWIRRRRRLRAGLGV